MNLLEKKHAEKRFLLAAAFLTAWIGVAFFVFQQVTFETNDDNAMARIAYGLGTTYYDPHLVYINVILGHAMTACLSIAPTVPWYTVFQCATVLLSFFVLIYLFMARFGVKKGVLPTLLLVFFFGAEFCLKLQFSKTAAIATLAGVLLIYDAVAPPKHGNPYWKWALGGLLTIVGSLYRFNSFGMTLVPLIGIGLWLLVNPIRNKDWKRLLEICLPFVIVFAICFACRQYNAWDYQQSELWASYKEFNSLRAQLLDYGFPDYEQHTALYNSLGINWLDLQMFKSWDFVDPEVFTVDTMRQLIAAKEKAPFDWAACFTNLDEFFFSYKYSVALMITLIVTLITSKFRNALIVFYTLLSVLALQVYLFMGGRYGLNRIDAAMAIALFVVLTLYGWDFWRYSTKIVAGVMAVLLLLSPYANFKVKQPEKSEKVPLYELIYSDPDSMYFRTMSTQTPTIPTSFEMYPVGYQQNYSALGGWAAYSVPYMEKLERFNITNPFRDMVDNPDVFLIAKNSVELRVQYIITHYNENAVARLVKITEDDYPIYRVTSRINPNLDTSNAILANGMPNINYSLSAGTVDGRTTFNGYLYADGVNSFSADVYLSVTDANGVEQLYYTTQQYSDAFGDLMNGQYGSFYTTKPDLPRDGFVRLYLDTADGQLYCVEMGTVDQIEAISDMIQNDPTTDQAA